MRPFFRIRRKANARKKIEEDDSSDEELEFDLCLSGRSAAELPPADDDESVLEVGVTRAPRWLQGGDWNLSGCCACSALEAKLR